MQNRKRNWPVVSKLRWGLWWILTRALENLKNVHFNGLLLNKVYNVWAKTSIVELCLMALNTDAKFEGKLTFAFKNDIRNFGHFHQSTWKSQNWDFDGILLSKVENIFELEIYRGVMCHDNKEWCKNSRGIDLSVQNWHEEFDKFWPEHSKISKICDLCFLKIFVYRLKNSNFILESKMVELNWKQNFLIYFENCQDVPNSHE